tara:strand:+ start:678 stop:1130 length:453 start_codon:yes stop_codon:yes gene_type:complete
MAYIKTLEEKCEALLKLVLGIQGYYKTTSSENKRLIETTIGAAIWYLPKSKKFLFTGKISKEAKEKKEKSEDHLYPRKIAAMEILNLNWSEEVNPLKTILNLFLKKYGRYNYVSKTENKKLIPFQKSGVFISPEIAYKKAGIELEEFRKD